MDSKPYEGKINSLIPKAVKEANRKIKDLEEPTVIRRGKDDSQYVHHFWSEFFHQAMNRLAFEAGFRGRIGG